MPWGRLKPPGRTPPHWLLNAIEASADGAANSASNRTTNAAASTRGTKPNVRADLAAILRMPCRNLSAVLYWFSDCTVNGVSIDNFGGRFATVLGSSSTARIELYGRMQV